MTNTEQKRIKAICEMAHINDICDLSDGYHTFNQLYYQRMMLFAALVKQNRDKAWKSLRHEDGELCFGGGWFIVGIDTPKGSYTYHYEDNYFSLFDCKELEVGKHWDGHTEKDVVRLLSLEKEPCEDAVSRRELIDKLEIVDKMYGSDFYWEMRRLVDRLSPVTPVQKTGKWIKCDTEEGYNTYADRFEFATYKCSKCGRLICDVGIGKDNPYGKKIEDYPYCHCGSKNEVEE